MQAQDETSSLITALHVKADGSQAVFQYDPTNNDALVVLQEKVGGWLEAAPVADRRLTMYCNEEGKLNDLPFNARATACLAPGNPDRIVGDVVLVGAPNYHGYDTSLPEEYLLVRRDGE